jgi:hypothetical protein
VHESHCPLAVGRYVYLTTLVIIIPASDDTLVPSHALFPSALSAAMYPSVELYDICLFNCLFLLNSFGHCARMLHRDARPCSHNCLAQMHDKAEAEFKKGEARFKAQLSQLKNHLALLNKQLKDASTKGASIQVPPPIYTLIPYYSLVLHKQKCIHCAIMMSCSSPRRSNTPRQAADRNTPAHSTFKASANAATNKILPRLIFTCPSHWLCRFSPG